MRVVVEAAAGGGDSDEVEQLGGAIFTESVFGLHGLGKLVVQSYDTFDLPTIQGVVVFSTVCIIVFNLVVDLLYAWIDPRIRLA